MSELTGETIRRDEHGEPTEVVQYAVLDDDGKHYIYGDQNWVAYGGAIRDGSHPDGRVQHRTATVTYGPWVDGAPETVALPAKEPTSVHLLSLLVEAVQRGKNPTVAEVALVREHVVADLKAAREDSTAGEPS